MGDNSNMSVATIKSELRDIADHIPDSASYNDAMYQLYVRMKIAKGKQAADEGRVVPHDEVKHRFSK
jgi:predicted transcriptional regulator